MDFSHQEGGRSGRQVDLLTKGAAALGIDLSAKQRDQFSRYYDELLVWNDRVNLTSVVAWEEVQARHFLDSLTVLLVMAGESLESSRFVDVGSGAGFPGLPLKIAFPRSRPTLIEATGKKTAFLTHLTTELGLEEVEVLTGRAETLAHCVRLRESFDLVLARGVAKMAALSEQTLPFCRLGGLVVCHKSRGCEAEVTAAGRAIETLGGRHEEIREVTLPELGTSRALVVLQKVRQTPANYPRRPGVPRRRPL